MSDPSPKSAARPRRVVEQGVVESAKMQKTIRVRVDRLVKHPLYGKYVKRKTILFAHDEEGSAREGDLVEVVFCRPLSKRKRWRLVRVLRQGSIVPEAPAPGEEIGASELDEGGES